MSQRSEDSADSQLARPPDWLPEALGPALIAINNENQIVVWSPAAERLLGWQPSAVIGRALLDLHLDSLAAFVTEVLESSGAAALDGLDLSVRAKDGRFVPVLVSVAGMSADDGTAVGVVLALTDLSPHVATDAVARATQERLQTLVQHSADLVALVDSAGTIQFLSSNVNARDAARIPELIGHNVLELVHPLDKDNTRDVLLRVTTKKDAEGVMVLRYVDGNGSDHWMEGRAVNLLDRESVGAVLVTLHDVTDRVASEAKLAYQATHDALTGLANRALFMDRLEHHVAHAGRHGLLVATLFWDVDGFKLVNDLAGHQVGDTVLIDVGRRAMHVVRTEDTVARIGGDEFVACAEVTTQRQAMSLAERLFARLQMQVVLIDGRSLTVTSSIGVACGVNVPAEELILAADLAMYEAKHSQTPGVRLRVVAELKSKSGGDARG